MDKIDQAQEKKYPGHYDCQSHDVITEWMKIVPTTVCRKCFGELSSHRIQAVASLVVDNHNKSYQMMQMQNTILELQEALAKTTLIVDGMKHREQLRSPST